MRIPRYGTVTYGTTRYFEGAAVIAIVAPGRMFTVPAVTRIFRVPSA